jgi:hypothetical protein
MVRNITRKPTDQSVTAGSLRLSLPAGRRRALRRRLSALKHDSESGIRFSEKIMLQRKSGSRSDSIELDQDLSPA